MLIRWEKFPDFSLVASFTTAVSQVPPTPLFPFPRVNEILHFNPWSVDVTVRRERRWTPADATRVRELVRPPDGNRSRLLLSNETYSFLGGFHCGQQGAIPVPLRGVLNRLFSPITSQLSDTRASKKQQ